ncbi:T9SS type A sorting domain-containing protein [Soonwooa sp.]|uniref:T9SS type A sorting domain-containing protein n=1 Tax=Soonwooa sp. TaxID=1938592 RepID=UPI002603C1C0|nr:T9SS type A sorting domain-containing protein [Soonwooa sp.]
MKKNQLLMMIVLMISSKGIAQQSINASGGNASGASGSIAFSVGQVFTKSVFTSTYSATEGVHQAYEISNLGIDDNPSIVLEMKVFPNPTTSILFLRNPDFSKNKNSKYDLYDVSGKLIKSNEILNEETQIDLQKENAGVYILRIFNDNKILKSFKIIKN